MLHRARHLLPLPTAGTLPGAGTWLRTLLQGAWPGRRRDHNAPRAPGLAPGMPPGKVDFGPVRLLSRSPPVLLSGISYDAYLGIAPAFAARYGNVAAGFVIFPTWSLESPGFPEAIRRSFTGHAQRHPSHRFRFICNTRGEEALLQGVGLPATFLNKNFMVSDRIFQPLPQVPVELDAVYNARFVPQKRHELAAAIPRVGYVSYIEAKPDPAQREQVRTLLATTLARNPQHTLLNRMVDGVPAWMPPAEVNAALARAGVGLILSAAEGSSYASMEYLLAGLPVVSTPSKGGRDVFFDPEHCLICDADPRAVRDAVAALGARNIPREVVRARTLALIEPERTRFLALVDDLIEELGGQRRHDGGAWPLAEVSGVPWLPFAQHLAALADASP